MQHTLRQFASETAPSGSLFDALGIDWTTLVLQVIAFGILVFLLAKFVFPQFIKIVDERQAKIDESLKSAHDAQAHADAAEEKVKQLLERASKDARAIVSTAKEEAAAIVTDAEQRAQAKSQALIDDAHKEIQAEVLKAKQALRDETLSLVATASATVLGEKLDSAKDMNLIERALKEAARD